MPAPARPQSRALLSALPATFSSPVRLSRAFPRRPRHLELRGSVLLLSKTPSSPDLADRLLVLTSATPPRPHGLSAVLLPSAKLSFPSRPVRDAFLRAAHLALAASAARRSAYRVLRELGRGASGVVHLAQRRSDNALFALKAIPKVDAFLSDSRLAHLVAERVALAQAAHRRTPFIVRLVDAFETASHLCFVTELAAYGDLSDVLRSLPDTRLPEPVARNVFAEVALGLEDAHRMAYLYRDLKPANLLLMRSGHVRLADLGLAKKVEMRVESASESVSEVSSSSSSSSSDDDDDDDASFQLVGRTSSFVGTRRYMSPEHIVAIRNRQRGYGAPADVWALGVTLYVMLTGQYPFGRQLSSTDSAGMFDAIRNEEITYPEWLSEDAVSMLRGLLDRDALERMELKDVKAHPWMSGLDWEQLRFDAAHDVPREDVLAVLREHNVQPVESPPKENNRPTPENDLFSSISGGSDDGSRRRRKGVMESFNLLGFAYSSSSSEGSF